VRLAIVPETPEVGTALDVLTAEFSKNGNVHLLERAEIERVYREQGLSAANTDYLKLGQILGADGLLLLQTATEGTNQFLNARLIAVKPGVVSADRVKDDVTANRIGQGKNCRTQNSGRGHSRKTMNKTQFSQRS